MKVWKSCAGKSSPRGIRNLAFSEKIVQQRIGRERQMFGTHEKKGTYQK
jgi:hypothetical protein